MSKTVTIRRVKDSDLPQVDSLLNQVNLVHHNGRPDLFNVGRKYTDEQLLEIFRDEKRPIFVAADEEDKCIGYAFCIWEQLVNDNIRTDVKTLYIDDICVDENARGLHVGETIYNAVIDYARQNGFYNVTLNVWSLNPGAQKFYEKMGMKPQKIGMETIL